MGDARLEQGRFSLDFHRCSDAAHFEPDIHGGPLLRAQLERVANMFPEAGASTGELQVPCGRALIT